jgi:flagellar basal body-associated protein FliL
MNEPAVAAKGAPEAAPKPEKKSGGMLGPLAAGVLLVAGGAGMGMYVSSIFTSVQTEGAATHQAEEAHKTDEVHGIDHLTEVTMPDLMSNVRNQAGRRYIKVSCAIWLTSEDAGKVGLGGAGGGHGGGGGGDNVKRIMQMALEEHLRSYDIDELTGPNISLQLKKGFKDRIEKTLHELYPNFKDDHQFVQRVVLTNLLVQ